MTATPVAAPGVAVRVHARRPAVVIVTLSGLCLLTAFLTLGVGAVRVLEPHAIEALFGHGTADQIRTIRTYELPRVLIAILVGSALAISGGVIQGVTRNPLAAPDIIGVVKGAALGTVFLLWAYPLAAVSYLPVAAFAGGIIAMVIVYLAAYKNGGTTPVRLALVGIAVSALCESIIRYVLLVQANGIGHALVWLTGSLAAIDMNAVYQILPWIAVILPLLVFYAHKLDVLGLGDDMASGLGLSVERTRRIALALAVLLASACVAVAGSLLFIGLIAPHMARRLVGSRHAVLLPTAALLGSLMLLVADAIGRGADPPIELPAGMVTAVIGAPYFVYLLTRSL
ncbi:MAG TPA: iron chelate uptake ABC transporter family permease subunit [Gaiellaceae bacterium]|jgi:iron complex transport system permease protein